MYRQYDNTGCARNEAAAPEKTPELDIAINTLQGASMALARNVNSLILVLTGNGVGIGITPPVPGDKRVDTVESALDLINKNICYESERLDKLRDTLSSIIGKYKLFTE